MTTICSISVRLKDDASVIGVMDQDKIVEESIRAGESSVASGPGDYFTYPSRFFTLSTMSGLTVRL